MVHMTDQLSIVYLFWMETSTRIIECSSKFRI